MGRKVQGLYPGGGEIFCTRPYWPRGPHNLLYGGYHVSVLGVKWLGHGLDHSPPSSAEIKERVELCLCSPSGSSWPVLGWTSPLMSQCFGAYTMAGWLVNITSVWYSLFICCKLLKLVDDWEVSTTSVEGPMCGIQFYRVSSRTAGLWPMSGSSNFFLPSSVLSLIF
jgi:hypothetical protein